VNPTYHHRQIGAALADRYLQAKAMLTAAESYFNGLSSPILAKHWQIWENEISTAEGRRMADSSAMDILATRPNCNTTGESRPAEEAMTPTEEIILLTLSIEEQQ